MKRKAGSEKQTIKQPFHHDDATTNTKRKKRKSVQSEKMRYKNADDVYE